MLLCLQYIQVDHEYPSAAAVPPCDKRGNSSDHTYVPEPDFKKGLHEKRYQFSLGLYIILRMRYLKNDPDPTLIHTHVHVHVIFVDQAMHCHIN